MKRFVKIRDFSVVSLFILLWFGFFSFHIYYIYQNLLAYDVYANKLANHVNGDRLVVIGVIVTVVYFFIAVFNSIKFFEVKDDTKRKCEIILMTLGWFFIYSLLFKYYNAVF